MPLDEIRLLPAQAWRRLLWTLLTYPETFGFPYGTLVTGLCMTMTVISCLPFITEYDLSFYGWINFAEPLQSDSDRHRTEATRSSTRR